MVLGVMVKLDDNLECAPKNQLFSFSFEEIVLWDSTLINTYDIGEVLVVWFYDVLTFSAVVLILEILRQSCQLQCPAFLCKSLPPGVKAPGEAFSA